MDASKPRIWGTLDPFLEPGPIWGRKVANEQFLKALLEQDPFDAYHFFLATPRQVQDFRGLVALQCPGPAADQRIKVFLRHELPGAFQEHRYACFHLSDCINHPPALGRLRNLYSQYAFPITSVTHSLSYPDYPARFLAHLWPGCTAQDCIVATSKAGKTAVEAAFQELRLRFNLGKDEFPQPLVDILPLGMREPFAPENHAQLRQQGRERLQTTPDQCLMLILGRISPHSKMDMLPLLRAWQRAFPRERPDAVLVVAGWTDQGDDFPRTFQNLARNVGLPCRLIPSPDELTKQQLYAAADLFLSLADNPQETFGLTLLEAALSGLPVIASDYSGYPDLVEHGQTGLLIPVWGPPDTSDIDILAGLIPDYEIQFLIAQQTAIHGPALAEALRTLCTRPDLRKALGEAGRKRALERYSWPTIIHGYLELWERLGHDAAQPPELCARPLELSYSRMFASFPSHMLDDAAHLRTTRTGNKVLRGDDYLVIYAGLEHLVSMDVLRPLLFFARKPERIASLKHKMKELMPGPDPWQIPFCIHWAVKHDLLEICAI